MKKLLFQIRTWNRAEKLKICLERIVEEVKKVGAEKDVIIFVIDNHSSDPTPRVLKELKKKNPFIVTYRYPKWCKMGEFLPIPQEILEKIRAEFMWNLGDDDIILKDAFALVWKFLNLEKTKDFAVIHVGNASNPPHSYKTYEATIWEFANLMGFNQFLGYSPSVIQNIVYREKKFDEWGRDYIEEVFIKKYRPLYQKTAFPHVLYFLHLFTYDPAVVMDYPIVSPMQKQTKEDLDRWEKENIGWKYFIFVKVLKTMYQNGILQEKFKPGFFKYLDLPLWERLLSEMIAARIGLYTANPRPEEGWEYIFGIADLIDDKVISKLIKLNVFLARGLCRTYERLKNELKTSPEDKQFLKETLKEVESHLIVTYHEITKPTFKPGWGGEGFEK